MIQVTDAVIERMAQALVAEADPDSLNYVLARALREGTVLYERSAA